MRYYLPINIMRKLNLHLQLPLHDLEHNHQFKYVLLGMEATGFYGVHLANYLSASDLLAPFSVRVYCLNPKEVKNYKKSFNDIGKNDGIDSYVIADFARVVCIAREKTYMLNNIYLKFCEYALLRDGKHPFANKYGATAFDLIFLKCFVYLVSENFLTAFRFA